MTTNRLDGRHTPELLEVQPARLAGSWLILGALAAMLGIGYAAGRFSASAKPAPAPPQETVAAMVGQAEEQAAEPAAVAAIEAPDDPAESAGASEEEAERDDGRDEQPAGGEYYVQVASYKREEDAAQYAVMLSARGLSAESSPDPSGARWYVVRLGPFPRRGQAEAARFQLKLHEREKAHVVPRSNGKYHVQVGSFASLEQAEPVAKRLAAQGHATKISRIKMGDRRWHCVRIGPFDTAEEAADYQKLITGMAGIDTRVIPFAPPEG